MCCVFGQSSLNLPVKSRHLDGIWRECPKTSHLYDVSLAQNSKCQEMAAYPGEF